MRDNEYFVGLMRKGSLLLLNIYVFACLCGCNGLQSESKPAKPLFELLPAAETGIDFTNTVTDNAGMNIFNYHNFYNGGGVATGDINNDGKTDIFFISNQGANKLYLNKGNFKFEDITANANIGSAHHWHTGVSMVDINADGWLDIYVCNAGIVNGDDLSNELFINQHDGTFKEEAKAWGLDDKGHSTQALFFDYDRDGDLDCFVLNNSPRSIESFDYTKKLRDIRDTVDADRLYQNNKGKFTDVSKEAGIYGSEIAFGLSVAAGDINNDGWTDLYVANDFFEKDYLYINQHNGTFKEISNDAIGHMSNGSMGSDLADINNDGNLDVFTSEMLPESDYRLKTTVKFDDYDVESAKQFADLHHQFTSNSLQLNNGDGTFSEIAQLAGVDATGWSWSALAFDFDNDGWKDIFVCNGITKDLTDQDFLAYFNTQNLVAQIKQGSFTFMDLLKKIPSVPLRNYAFRNLHNLTFKDASAELGFDITGFSNGASYADLDNDGDLDLVINNENSPASVYRNSAAANSNGRYLSITLQGDSANTFGYGTKVTVMAGNSRQVTEQAPCRGFQGSVDPVLHFGMDTVTVIDSILVQWPDARVQVLKNVSTNKTITLRQQDASVAVVPASATTSLYANITMEAIAGTVRHRENPFIDFDVERLIPKMLSAEGPKLAVADINGDALEDVFMCSSIGDTAKLLVQQPGGNFKLQRVTAFEQDHQFENSDAAFFDADGDGDADLLLVSGGNQAAIGSATLQPRLYMNDGKGNFTRNDKALPGISVNASCVKTGDYDGDGKTDVFIGARNVPGSYGIMPASVLLKNDGNGVFADVTGTVAPVLRGLGMVTAAEWVDMDGKGKNSLVVAGDWMPITILQYSNESFQKKSEVPHSSGWWNCIKVADINQDGRPDLVAGNFGLNSRIRANEEHPAKMYTSDFDKNGQTECIPVYYKTDGKAYPHYLKGEMEAQVPSLKKKFLHFSEYAGKSITEIFTPEQLQQAGVLIAEQTQTCIFLNDGKGGFTMQPLPLMAQLSPTYAINVTDLNGDGIPDIFLAGNFYGVKPQTGRFDASYGTTLMGNKSHTFDYLSPSQSGLFVKGQARDVVTVDTKNGQYVLVAINNGPLQVFGKKNGISTP